jgi:cytochrome b subunit of formate dehydrogenase
MDKYIILLIIIILLLFLYWCYKKYTNKKNIKNIKNIQNLSEKIKNNITITMYNMNQFLNVSQPIKKILLNIAYEYKHNDIINLLR